MNYPRRGYRLPEALRPSDLARQDVQRGWPSDEELAGAMNRRWSQYFEQNPDALPEGIRPSDAPPEPPRVSPLAALAQRPTPGLRSEAETFGAAPAPSMRIPPSLRSEQVVFGSGPQALPTRSTPPPAPRNPANGLIREEQLARPNLQQAVPADEDILNAFNQQWSQYFEQHPEALPPELRPDAAPPPAPPTAPTAPPPAGPPGASVASAPPPAAPPAARPMSPGPDQAAGLGRPMPPVPQAYQELPGGIPEAPQPPTQRDELEAAMRTSREAGVTGSVLDLVATLLSRGGIAPGTTGREMAAKPMEEYAQRQAQASAQAASSRQQEGDARERWAFGEAQSAAGRAGAERTAAGDPTSVENQAYRSAWNKMHPNLPLPETSTLAQEPLLQMFSQEARGRQAVAQELAEAQAARAEWDRQQASRGAESDRRSARDEEERRARRGAGGGGGGGNVAAMRAQLVRDRLALGDAPEEAEARVPHSARDILRMNQATVGADITTGAMGERGEGRREAAAAGATVPNWRRVEGAPVLSAATLAKARELSGVNERATRALRDLQSISQEVTVLDQVGGLVGIRNDPMLARAQRAQRTIQDSIRKLYGYGVLNVHEMPIIYGSAPQIDSMRGIVNAAAAYQNYPAEWQADVADTMEGFGFEYDPRSRGGPAASPRAEAAPAAADEVDVTIDGERTRMPRSRIEAVRLAGHEVREQ